MEKIVGERDWGIDVLRILLAFMVVIIHINAPATGDVYSHVTRLPMKFLVYGIMALIYPAVNCYILISGFYAYKNNRGFRGVFYGLLKLWLCLLFFSVGGYLVTCLLGYHGFDLTVLIQRFFPLTTGEWWFMTNYFALMLISPILNDILSKFNKIAFIKWVFIAILVCSILPFFIKWDDSLGLLNGSGLIWFVVLYLTGGGLYKFFVAEKVFVNKKLARPRVAFIVYILLSFLLVFAGFCFGKFSLTEGYTLSRYNSPVVYLQAVFLFFAFYFWKIRCGSKLKKVIAFFSGLSLASYILHCQSDVETIIWRNTQPAYYADSFMLIPVSCFMVLGIYLFAILIEFLRKKITSIFGMEKGIIQLLMSLIFENKHLKKYLKD